MTSKVLSVSCLVKEAHVWELLSLLKASKAANVEVHPVGTPSELNGQKHRRKLRTGIRRKVGKFMVIKEKHRPGEIAEALNANPKSVYSALTALVEDGELKKTAPGEFMRVKEPAQ